MIVSFTRRERNIPEIQSMYEVSWAKLSDRYFKTIPWPSVQHISDAVDHDHVFCLLYSEMYYRHLYARCQPDLSQRIESWENYQALFGLLLHSNVNMQLPPCWMWDMIEEFIYQFQSWNLMML
jgi:translation initiation factor 3 subunit L